MASTEEPTLEGFERTTVARAYEGLPERWRSVLWYAEVENMTPAQIAPMLGLTANGVAALAYRAREGLRQAYLQQHLSSAVSAECERANGLLGSYVRGGLAKRETAVVESHLEDCSECRALVLELGDVSQGMRGIVAPLVLGLGAIGLVGAGFPIGGAAVGAAAAGGSGSAGSGTGAAGSGSAGSGAAAGSAGTAGSTGAVGAGAGAAGTATAGAAAGAAGTAGVAGLVGAGSAVGAAGGFAAMIAAAPFAAALIAVGALAVVGVGVVVGINALSDDDAPGQQVASGSQEAGQDDAGGAGGTDGSGSTDGADGTMGGATDDATSDSGSDDATSDAGDTPTSDADGAVTGSGAVDDPTSPTNIPPALASGPTAEQPAGTAGSGAGSTDGTSSAGGTGGTDGTDVPAPPVVVPPVVVPPTPASLDLQIDDSITLEARQAQNLVVSAVNSGGTSASGVSVEVVLPPGVDSPSSAAISGGTSVPGTLSMAEVPCGRPDSDDLTVARTVTCALGTIGPGDSAGVSVRVRADSGGEYAFAARAWGTGIDRVERRFAPTRVAYWGGEVAVALDAPGGTLGNPGSATATLKLRNSGDRAVDDAAVTLAVPAGLELVSAGGDWDCDSGSGAVDCSTSGELGRGEVRSGTLRLVSAIDESGDTATPTGDVVVHAAARAVQATGSRAGQTVTDSDDRSFRFAEPWGGTGSGSGVVAPCVPESDGEPASSAVALDGPLRNASMLPLTATLVGSTLEDSATALIAAGESAELSIDTGILRAAGDASLELRQSVGSRTYTRVLDGIGEYSACDLRPQVDVQATEGLELAAREASMLELAVSNAGGTSAVAVETEVVIPAGVNTPSSAMVSGGASVAGALTVAEVQCGRASSDDVTVARTVTCAAGTIEPGETTELSVPVTAASGGEYVFASSTSGTGFPTVERQFRATASYWGADLGLVLDGPGSVVANPGTADVAMTLANRGDRAAGEVDVEVTVPDGFGLYGADGDWSCEPGDGTVECASDGIGVGKSRTGTLHLVTLGDGRDGASGDTLAAGGAAEISADAVATEVSPAGPEVDARDSVSFDVEDAWGAVGEVQAQSVCLLDAEPGAVRSAIALGVPGAEGSLTNSSVAPYEATLIGSGPEQRASATLDEGQSADLTIDTGLGHAAGDARLELRRDVRVGDATRSFLRDIEAGSFEACDAFAPDVETPEFSAELRDVDGEKIVVLGATFANTTEADLQVWFGDTSSATVVAAGEKVSLERTTDSATYEGTPEIGYRWVDDAAHGGDHGTDHTITAAEALHAAYAPEATVEPGACTWDPATGASGTEVTITLDNSASTFPAEFEYSIGSGDVESVDVPAGSGAGSDPEASVVVVHLTAGAAGATLSVSADGTRLAVEEIPEASCVPWITDVATPTVQCSDDGFVVVTGTLENDGAARIRALALTNVRLSPGADPTHYQQAVDLDPGATGTYRLVTGARSLDAGQTVVVGQTVLPFSLGLKLPGDDRPKADTTEGIDCMPWITADAIPAPTLECTADGYAVIVGSVENASGVPMRALPFANVWVADKERSVHYQQHIKLPVGSGEVGYRLVTDARTVKAGQVVTVDQWFTDGSGTRNPDRPRVSTESGIDCSPAPSAELVLGPVAFDKSASRTMQDATVRLRNDSADGVTIDLSVTGADLASPVESTLGADESADVPVRFGTDGTSVTVTSGEWTTTLEAPAFVAPCLPAWVQSQWWRPVTYAKGSAVSDDGANYVATKKSYGVLPPSHDVQVLFAAWTRVEPCRGADAQDAARAPQGEESSEPDAKLEPSEQPGTGEQPRTREEQKSTNEPAPSSGSARTTPSPTATTEPRTEPTAEGAAQPTSDPTAEPSPTEGSTTEPSSKRSSSGQAATPDAKATPSQSATPKQSATPDPTASTSRSRDRGAWARD
ncbi:hypothetical protein GCM10025865_17690 [Paraoerskovia sediminicola]|uniref:Putative zinc-finger domain-containing protein n=1 Tax=Paraoerskovia sediminicola TaxID=1138587 RepID=A0ABM8G374_9CELL|nr:zf-HC2 domain-containing protein [Paraoerskovia sediminicola]BDZ42470.1 hypothetical protein GCM10025865_17690 [Paraoerskovia sediminicola]